MKYFTLMLFLQVFPPLLLAQEIQGFAAHVPSEYQQTWQSQKKYDVVLYKLLQLGIGIEAGDRFIIPVEVDLYEYPPMTDVPGLAVALFYTLYSPEPRAMFGKDSGVIVAVFANIPVDSVDYDTVIGYLFGEYLGRCEPLNAPLIKADYFLLEDDGYEITHNDYGEMVLDETILEAIDSAIRQNR